MGFEIRDSARDNQRGNRQRECRRCADVESKFVLGPSSGGQGPQGTSSDQILGEVIVGGVAQPLRASTSYYPMAVDQALVEQSNHDRVSQLVQAFAYWAAREV